MIRRLGDNKHLWLLVTLVASQISQPLLAHASAPARILSALVMLLVGAAVFMMLLRSGRERRIGLALITPAIVVEIVHYAFPASYPPWFAPLCHISLAVFLAYATVVILDHVFRKETLAIDDILGAFSGYLMTGIVFGHLYTLVWLLSPDSFNVDPHITWQLGEWHTRRSLFNYFSFATLASIGYGDIETTAPGSNTLVWMEVMFGQFYLAVVVATIVGTRLARTSGAKEAG